MSNYPPGVTGNEPEIAGDVEWDKFYDKIEADSIEMALYAHDADLIWELGKITWKKLQSVLKERAHAKKL